MSSINELITADVLKGARRWKYIPKLGPKVSHNVLQGELLPQISPGDFFSHQCELSGMWWETNKHYNLVKQMVPEGSATSET